MKTTIIDKTAVEIIEDKIPDGIPFTMVNLVCFRFNAEYASHDNIAPCSGREAYFNRYVPAFEKAVKAAGVAGIEVEFIGSVAGNLVALKDEHWDMIILIRYSDFATFRKVSESSVYLEKAELHRLAALEDWRLIVTLKNENR